MRESRAAIEGERKQVTILFADIKDSTRLIEALDPEQAAAILQPPLLAMIEAVHRYEGTVNRVQGDGIMALFGAPLAHEDNAVRAAYAALEMQGAINRLRDDRIAIRVGLHAGEVVVQSLNNDLSMDYDAVGASVHIAARMEKLAGSGTIRCTGDVVRQAAGLVRFEPRGPTEVDGLGRPIPTFEVVGHTAARTRWEVSTMRGLSPFAGRASELVLLDEARSLAARGDGQVVTVVGDAGCGKTRLIHEFIQRSCTDDWSVLRSAATPRSAETPYLAISTLLRNWLEIDAADPVELTQTRVDMVIRELGEGVASVRPALQTLLDLPVQDAEWSALDPVERRSRTGEALQAVALRGFLRRPTVLWFEDLQWVDAETRALVQDFAPRIAGSRCMLIVTFRAGSPGLDWTDAAHHRRIVVEPLEGAAAGSLVAALLGAGPDFAALRGLVLERTEGVPLFIEETVRDLEERGLLTGARGAYSLAGEVDAIRIPATVEGVLSARIDRLRPQWKSLLQLASVVGREVPIGFFRRLAETEDASFQDALETFEASEFMRPDRAGSAAGLVFKHALTQEVAYGTLLLRQRRSLHARVVRLMEDHYAETLGERVEELGYHALRGELWDEAARYLGQAGAKAVEISAYGQGRAFLEQALEAASHLPEADETIRRRIDIRLALRELLGATVEFDRVHRSLEEAEAMATAIADDRRLAQVNIAQTFILNVNGQLDASVTTGLRAATLARRLGHPGMTVTALFYLAQSHLWRGEVRDTQAILAGDAGWIEGGLRRMRLGTTGTASVLWLTTLASAHTYLGAFDEAGAACEAARVIAAEGDRPYDVASVHFYTGFTLSHAGEVDAALVALRQGLEVCTANRVQLLIPVLSTTLGYTEALGGDAARGIGLLERAVAFSNQVRMPYLEGQASAYLGYAKLLHGCADEALADVLRAVEVARAHRMRGVEAAARRMLGMCWMRGSKRDPENALRHLEAAASIAAELRLLPDLAHCYSEMALLHEATGDRAASRTAAADARSLYARLGMAFWTDRAGGPAAARARS
jgi:class 3 adenylate cyclase/tetratricopeptide (TPR) repeat protein